LDPSNDDTDQWLDILKEKLKTKEEEKPEEVVKKETTTGYWTAPLKSKEEENLEKTEKSETRDEKIESGVKDWIKTERDYYYEELVDHVYSILKDKNPQLNTEKTKRITMKPPQVLREGTTKTNFANFADICSTMNRPQDHVQSFLLAEMGSTASIDGNGCLIIKGKWQGKGIESLLRKYMQEYVVCQLCGSMDTVLSRNSTTRLFSLHCSTCNANRTVTSINKGYQTVANKKEKKALLKV
jgi:translation initiation factor 2 subunit 2